MKDLKSYIIGIFRGGDSPERDISLVSGEHVYKALKKKGYKVVDIDLRTQDEKEIVKIIKDNNINIVFVALHGGFGEDGRLQKVLEKYKIPFTSSGSESSYLSMDKIETRRVLKDNQIPFPKTWEIKQEIPSFFQKDLPLVVKPHYGGSSVGISIVNELSSLSYAVDKAKRISHKVLLEEYIKGRELTVGIVGDKVLPIVEIVFKKDFFDFVSKYQDRKTEFIVPAEIEQDLYSYIQELTYKVYRTLGCKGMGRVDLILDNKNNPFILEMNSVPGLTPHSLLPLAASNIGWSFEDLCEKVLELAIK